MKKEILFSFAFVILFPILIFAQNFGAVGTTWYYGGNIGAPPINSGYVKVESVKDTMVDGFLSQILLSEDYNYLGAYTNTYRDIIRSSNDSVFFYSPVRNEFVLIYKFDLSVGDTFELDNPYFDFIPKYRLVVDSITTVSYNGENFRKFHSHDLDSLNLSGREVYTEKFGREDWLFPFLGVSIPEHYGPIRCFSNQDISINFQSYPCDFSPMNAIDDLRTEKAATIFPNPVVEKLYIKTDFPTEKFVLYNSQGAVLLETKEMEVDCSDFPSGLYVGLVYFKEGRVERVSVLVQK